MKFNSSKTGYRFGARNLVTLALMAIMATSAFAQTNQPPAGGRAGQTFDEWRQARVQQNTTAHPQTGVFELSPGAKAIASVAVEFPTSTPIRNITLKDAWVAAGQSRDHIQNIYEYLAWFKAYVDAKCVGGGSPADVQCKCALDALLANPNPTVADLQKYPILWNLLQDVENLKADMTVVKANMGLVKVIAPDGSEIYMTVDEWYKAKMGGGVTMNGGVGVPKKKDWFKQNSAWLIPLGILALDLVTGDGIDLFGLINNGGGGRHSQSGGGTGRSPSTASLVGMAMNIAAVGDDGTVRETVGTLGAPGRNAQFTQAAMTLLGANGRQGHSSGRSSGHRSGTTAPVTTGARGNGHRSGG
ncbi:hypothetical protein JNK13_06915 [bacterium]|nr:hypothetical protein [bacterium]